MELEVFDNIVGSSLVPCIMSILTSKMYNYQSVDILYATATVGTLVSAATCTFHFRLRNSTRSRNNLTLMTTSVLTMSLLASIILFHLLRLNFSPKAIYKLPEALGDLEPSSPLDVFRRHLHADIIPGFILFSQVLLCLNIKFELLNRARRKFSFGEASIVAQLASVAYVVWSLTIYTKLSGAGPFIVSQTTDILLNIGMSLFLVVFLPAYLLLKHQNTLSRYCLLAAGFAVTFVVTRALVKTARIDDPLTWLVEYIFTNERRIILFSIWLSALSASIGFSFSWSMTVGQTNNLVRKVFHIAICVVFITGYSNDLEFTSFASGGTLIVMLVLEMIRAWNLWPIGSCLESVCQSLRGKWDNRYLTVSHIYLLLGTMIPLWLLPQSGLNHLSLLSGFLAVGVGDAFAAIFGTLCGKTKLGLSSGKSLEGFIANILSIVFLKLSWFGYAGFIGEFTFVFATITTAFVELISCDCDNLILPLVMMFSLEIF